MPPSRSHVLIVSTSVDEATDEVNERIAGQGARVTRVNTEDFPFSCELTAYTRTGGKPTEICVRTAGSDEVDLSDITSVWYRRVRAPERPPEMDPGVYEFALREARAALLGSILSLPVRCMSPPANVWAAEHKVYQLTLAQELGFPVPATVVTNNPEAVRAAYERFSGEMVVKPTRTGYLEVGGEPHAIFTSAVLEERLIEVESAHLSPAIYQRHIPKECDLRITVVGQKLFVAEIDSQTDPSARIDWRRTEDRNLPHRHGGVPESVARRIRLLMDRLGLYFGALDFIRTPEGELVFLEVNPNGQWLWLDDLLQLGITDAVSAWLIGECS